MRHRQSLPKRYVLPIARRAGCGRIYTQRTDGLAQLHLGNIGCQIASIVVFMVIPSSVSRRHTVNNFISKTVISCAPEYTCLSPAEQTPPKLPATLSWKAHFSGEPISANTLVQHGSIPSTFVPNFQTRVCLTTHPGTRWTHPKFVVPQLRSQLMAAGTISNKPEEPAAGAFKCSLPLSKCSSDLQRMQAQALSNPSCCQHDHPGDVRIQCCSCADRMRSS